MRDLHKLKTFAGEDVFHVVVESPRGFIAATVLEGKEPRILGWDDGDAALELIRSSAT